MTDGHEIDGREGGSEIDAAIDRAVHAMMEGDADPSFRARVMARLEHSHPRARPGWWAAAGAAATAAGLALTLALQPASRPSEPRETARHGSGSSTSPPSESTPTRPSPTESARATRLPTESASIGRLVDRSLGPPSPGPGRGRALRAASAVAVEAGPDPETGRLTAGVEPMEDIHPIAVGPLELGEIAPASIAVASLAPIGELQIQQLFTPTGRD